MSIIRKLAVLVPTCGLMAAVVSPVFVNEKPRTWSDLGIPDFEMVTPSLVRYNGDYIKLGKKPTTEKHYNINGFKIVEESADGIVKRVIVMRPYSDKHEFYISQSERIEKNLE